jgi:hypothetical protein
LAAISVKSTIDKAAIDEAANATEVLRSLPRRAISPGPGLNVGPVPAVFVFGFQGLELSTLREHVRDACEGIGSPKILSGVCVLGAGVVTPVNAEGNVSVDDIQNYGIGQAREGAWGIFVGLLWNALTFLTITPVAPNLLSYIRAGDLLDLDARSWQ